MVAVDQDQIASQVDIAQNLKHRGYCIVPNLTLSLEMQAYGDLLRASYDDLPLDPYSRAGNRDRRFGRFRIDPSDGELKFRRPTWDPSQKALVAEYFQDAYLNPDDGGIRRKFAALTPDQWANPFLEMLIRFDFDQLELNNKNAAFDWLVGVHFLRHVAEPSLPGISSPDCLHRDGEPATFVHLIERRNVVGGVNYIAPIHHVGRRPPEVPQGDIIHEFTLDVPLSSFAVIDEKVSHYVSPIEVAPGAERGMRSVLLIDFTPLVPRTV